MKLYLSADIEGIAGASHWDEASKGGEGYEDLRELMTRQVVAACESATQAGVTEILVKDAHSSGRNLILKMLPDNVRVIRGWSGSPMGMVQELDSSFAGLMLIGWHACAGSAANPLAHTLTEKYSRILINGQPASEMSIYATLAGTYNVPLVFISGDEEICAQASELTDCVPCPVSKGVGASSISLSPAWAEKEIRSGVQRAVELRKMGRMRPLTVAPLFKVEVVFIHPAEAYQHSWYPGAVLANNHTVAFETDSFLEAKKFISFTEMTA